MHHDLYFTVCYTGDNSLTVVKEEDGDSFLRTQYVYEPFLAHVKVENVSYDYWAWVDITVKMYIPLNYRLKQETHSAGYGRAYE